MMAPKEKKFKQLGLGAFGFTKRVEHRGEAIDVGLPELATNEKKKWSKLNCKHCDETNTK